MLAKDHDIDNTTSVIANMAFATVTCNKFEQTLESSSNNTKDDVNAFTCKHAARTEQG